MSIPALINGFLPKGIHTATITELASTFGGNSDSRRALAELLPLLVHNLEEEGAVDVYVAGSFVTNKEHPRDIDLLVVHGTKNTIPLQLSDATDSPIAMDIQYASVDEPEILSSFLSFLSTRRNGNEVGLVRLPLSDRQYYQPLPPSDPRIMQAIMVAYTQRHVSDPRRGLLVTVHGILTNAHWNADVARLASSQGWVVAPYIYKFTMPWVLISKSRRRKEVHNFHTWLDKVAAEENLPISIIAHSFGTYIAGRYLTGWGGPVPRRIKSLVLVGAILDTQIRWNEHASSVERVLNEIAPNDSWVRRMWAVEWLRRGDPLGRAGTKGFAHKSAILTQTTVQNFDHNNPLNPTVIRGRWLPFLNFRGSPD